MANSQNAAKYVALRRLGYKVTRREAGRRSLAVIARPARAAACCEPGDIITSVDGTKVTTPDALDERS